MTLKLEIKLLREELLKFQYLLQRQERLIESVKFEMKNGQLEVLRQLQDTEHCLEYVKSYVGLEKYIDKLPGGDLA